MAWRWDAPAKIGLAARDGICRPRYDRAARQWDALVKIRYGSAAMGCAGKNRRWDAPAKIGNDGAAMDAPDEIGDGMCRPRLAMVARRLDAPAEIMVARQWDAPAEIMVARQ